MAVRLKTKSVTVPLTDQGDAVMRVRAEAGDRDFAQAIEQWKARSSDSEPAPSAG